MVNTNILIMKDNIVPYAHTNDVLLTELVIPKGVRIIGRGAFAGCKLLNSVVIPKTVTVIEEGAFMNCPLLTKVEIKGNPAFQKDAFLNCPNLKTFILGKQIFNVYCFSRTKSYAVTIAKKELFTDKNQIYIGTFVPQHLFPYIIKDKLKLDQQLFFVETDNKRDSLWFGKYLDITTMGSQYKISQKSFTEFFGIQLTENTPISYTIFALLTGICDIGRPLWRVFSNNQEMVPISIVRKVLKDNCERFSGFQETLERLDVAYSRKDEVFNYLDINNIVVAPKLLFEIKQWLFNNDISLSDLEEGGNN